MNHEATLAPLLAAIAADDDEQAEALVLQLTATAESALLNIARDGNADQRWWAVRALAHCGTTNALPTLVAMVTDEDAALRVVAAMSLGALATRLGAALTPYLPELAARLADDEGAVRQAAADALVQCGDAAVEPLVAVLRFRPHEGARSRAAYALRKIGTPATVPALFRCLNDPNYLVHTYAYEALDEMGLLETELVI
ncbi:MAG: HEAT repeat domain-containing protein [Caldilinea sp. CFX5]|nr:HEAT repeat domain-containing protein [Caldilinea sp. CFX5]